MCIVGFSKNRSPFGLSQQLALVDAHISKSNQAACGSSTAGMRLEESAVLVCLLLEKLPDVGCPTEIPKILIPSCEDGKLSSPHHTTAPALVNWATPCQSLNSWRNHTPAVPHLRLAVVHPVVRVGENLFFQNLGDVEHPFTGTCHIDVVEACKHLLSVRPAPR